MWGYVIGCWLGVLMLAGLGSPIEWGAIFSIGATTCAGYAALLGYKL